MVFLAYELLPLTAGFREPSSVVPFLMLIPEWLDQLSDFGAVYQPAAFIQIPKTDDDHRALGA